jgi:hypothetical protein
MEEALDSTFSTYLVAVSGGKVIGFLNIWLLPDLVDGEPSGAVAALAKKCLRADPATARGRTALRKALAPRLEVLDAKGKDAATVLAQWRKVNGDNVYFFLNTDERRSVKATICLPEAAKVVFLDATTGDGRVVEPRVRAKRATVSHVFGPRESLLAVQAGKTVSLSEGRPISARAICENLSTGC